MRVNPTTLTLLTLLAIAFGTWTHFEESARERDLIANTSLARQRIVSEVRLRSALAGAEISRHGWVRGINPAWFPEGRPLNPWFLNRDQLWIDVDSRADSARLDPESIEASRHDAGWWYNPANGVIRARVPAQKTSQATRDLYESVNR